MRELEDDNAKLKKLLAAQMSDGAALRELLKKWQGPLPSAKLSRICRSNSNFQNGGLFTIVGADRKVIRYSHPGHLTWCCAAN